MRTVIFFKQNEHWCKDEKRPCVITQLLISQKINLNEASATKK